MITNAKGQLGGLDSPDDVRRRLASESPAFKCAVCSKTNGDIIKECEERTKEAGEPSEDVQVPQDLNMGFRDEMEAASAAAAAAAAKTDEDTTAELAEGFVQTVPTPTGNAVTTGADATPSSAARARPAQSVPQPTRTVPSPSAQPQPLQQQIARRAADDSIPAWIDRMIVVLVVLLAILVLKVLFAI
jgi:ubiquitin-conjugating enzyme E2 J1